MNRKYAIVSASVVGAGVLLALAAVMWGMNSQTNPLPAVTAQSVDPTTFDVVEIAGDENTAKVLKMLKAEEKAKKVKDATDVELNEKVAKASKSSVFVISDKEIDAKKDNKDFQKILKDILDKRGAIVAAGNNTSVLYEALANAEIIRGGSQPIDTPVAGFKFKEVTENGATIVGKSEYHLGSPEFGYDETTGAQQIAEWLAQ